MSGKQNVLARAAVALLALLLVTGIALIGLAEEGVTPIKLGAVNPLADITGDQMSKAMQLAVDCSWQSTRSTPRVESSVVHSN
jgi:hypothetical protein